MEHRVRHFQLRKRSRTVPEAGHSKEFTRNIAKNREGMTLAGASGPGGWHM